MEMEGMGLALLLNGEDQSEQQSLGIHWVLLSMIILDRLEFKGKCLFYFTEISIQAAIADLEARSWIDFQTKAIIGK